MSDRRISVAVVDDQALFRAGIRMLIESQPDLRCAGEAGTGLEAIDLASRTDPDVILMDLRMPAMNGIEAIRHILGPDAHKGDRPRIVVLTTFELDEAAASAIRAGASGFLLKNSKPSFLLEAIRTVHSGTAVVAPSAIRDLFAQFDTHRSALRPAEFDTLTDRERQVFLMAAGGLSNSEIAAAAYLAETTVKTHISSILSKLSLRDRVQLVVYAFENRLTERKPV